MLIEDLKRAINEKFESDDDRKNVLFEMLDEVNRNYNGNLKQFVEEKYQVVVQDIEKKEIEFTNSLKGVKEND